MPEVANETGLIAWRRDGALPTTGFGAWPATSPADRLATLLDVWWRMERLPHTFEDPGDGGIFAGGLTTALFPAMSRTGDLPNVPTRLIDDVARRHGEVRVVATGCCARRDTYPPADAQGGTRTSSAPPRGLRRDGRTAPATLARSPVPSA